MEEGMVGYVLQWVGAAIFLATLWAALQIDGSPLE
jgi:hypothetical protein